MANVRTYALIYVALLLLGTGKFLFFEAPFIGYDIALTATFVLAIIKTLLIAGFYQHLLEEPRSITYMMVTALFMVLLLTIAAGFSIQ